MTAPTHYEPNVAVTPQGLNVGCAVFYLEGRIDDLAVEPIVPDTWERWIDPNEDPASRWFLVPMSDPIFAAPCTCGCGT